MENEKDINAEIEVSADDDNGGKAVEPQTDAENRLSVNERKKKKEKKPVSRKKVLKRRRAIFFSALTVFVGIVVAGASIVGIMNKPRELSKEIIEYDDLTALQQNFNLLPVKELSEYKDNLGADLWLLNNEMANNLFATSDYAKETAYEIFSVLYTKLLREENVQALTDGRTTVGGITSPCQNDKKLITTYADGKKQQDMFINIWGNAMNMGIPDERHYLNLTDKTVRTNNTQFSKGWLNYTEAEYVANYMYQARWFHHTVSIESINKVYFHKVDKSLVEKRDDYIATKCHTPSFYAGGLTGVKTENYSSRYNPTGKYEEMGNYYEILFYLDGKISGTEIERQTKSASNAKDLTYTGNAVVGMVMDENYVLNSVIMYEEYNLINPYGLAIKGSAKNAVSEFYYYGEEMWSNGENGEVTQGYVGFTGVEDGKTAKGAGMATLDKLVVSVFTVIGILCGGYIATYLLWKFTGLGIPGITKLYAGMDEILFMSGKPVKDVVHRKAKKEQTENTDKE